MRHHVEGEYRSSPDPCVAFTYQARTEIFASIFSLLTSSHLACSARSGGFHSLLCRRSGTSLIYCFNTERRGFNLPSGCPPHTVLLWWILSQSIACCVRRGPYTNGRPGDRTSTSPPLLNEFNWEHTEHARPRGRSVTCIRSILSHGVYS